MISQDANIGNLLNAGFNFDPATGRIIAIKVIDTETASIQHQISFNYDGGLEIDTVMTDIDSSNIGLTLKSSSFILDSFSGRVKALKISDTLTASQEFILEFDAVGAFNVYLDDGTVFSTTILTAALIKKAFNFDYLTERVVNIRTLDFFAGYNKYLISILADGSFSTPQAQDYSSGSSSIFGSNSLVVNFDRLNQDLLARGRSRLLYQFKNAKILDQLIQTVSDVNQAMYDSAWECLASRTVAEATGFQLDILGQIVGQSRTMQNASLRSWFTPDLQLNAFDLAPVWCLNGPLAGDVLLDDGQYRMAILAKIFRNHVQGGSVPELRRFVFLMSGIKVSFVVTGILEVSLAVPIGTPLNKITALMTVYNNSRVEESYLIPFGTCTIFDTTVYYIVVTDPAGNGISFMPDKATGEPDVGLFSIKVNL